MPHFPTVTELRGMSPKDLEKSRREHEVERAKLHLALIAGKEKNSATLRAERRQIARIRTVQGEQMRSEQPKTAEPSVLKKKTTSRRVRTPKTPS